MGKSGKIHEGVDMGVDLALLALASVSASALFPASRVSCCFPCWFCVGVVI